MNIQPISINNKTYNPKIKTAKNTSSSNTRNEIKFSGIKPLFHIPFFVHQSKNNQDNENLFFKNMKYYPKNHQWAKQMSILSETLSESIKRKAPFEDILLKIQDNLGSINKDMLYGQYRHTPAGFCIIENKPDRGIEYLSRYKKLLNSRHTDNFQPKSNSQYPNANTCTITMFNLDNDTSAIQIDYGVYTDSLNTPIHRQISNLELAKKEYNKLLGIKNPTLKQINQSCATINWLIAQESPFKRGSDSVARLLTTSIYKAYKIQTSPPKQGISFDFEAFYSNLDDYIVKYPDLFSQKLYKI